MKHFTDLIADALPEVEELFPWDLEEKLEQQSDLILLDVREPSEFDTLHIEGSMNVPRGVLESACDWDYDETEPELAGGREREIIVICRSGNRSVLAAQTMQRMGFKNVTSLKTGIRGWNDFEQPLYNAKGNQVDIDDADEILASKVRDDQRRPEA
ncbi:MAG: rhodanese-like domain-containing protein [Gammaproteobacteria bacterium]|nr:rhodanese-like domain-containing protein [Gammaproteobacteria bacterium]MCW8841156.1 rhodanese-like domain-containing protein [Gammaproteobacteria bacterium]MCW8958523.1 rhodanese-like domain-containing protein [Gammaproteobacteria bacterium]MCW8973680.1 rhodanese-like domain-containing protein [Gammaproteobacteria bacterium]MCW8992796.1 rhodanese-like domain-containing protein [Gammaproteobacteria bacterium]